MNLGELIERVSVRQLARERLLLLVSGGRDSMVLLRLAAELSKQGRLVAPPVVFHLDHGLRADSADDRLLVADECGRFGLSFQGLHRRVGVFARRTGLGIEAAGRALRYRAAGRLLRRGLGTVAVTAHHADDYLETVLLHLIRGSGPAAFEALPMRAQTFGTPVLRPFLPFRRDELEQVATAEQVPFHEDSTNQDETLRRNRIRARVVPLLVGEGLDPSALWRRFQEGLPETDDTSLPTLSQNAAGVLSAHVSLDRRLLYPATPRQVKRALDVALRALGIAPARESLVRIVLEAALGGERFRLRWHSKEVLLWAASHGPVWFFLPSQGALLLPEFEDVPGGVRIHFMGRTAEYALGSDLVAVRWKPGLRVPFGRSGSKELAKVYQELGVPLPVRRFLPVLCDARSGLVKRICLSFWESGQDRVFA